MDILQEKSFQVLDKTPVDVRSINTSPVLLRSTYIFTAENTHLLSNSAAIHRQTTSQETVIPMHSHDFTEIIYCRQAQGVEYLVDSRRYRLQNGDVVFVPAGVAHRPLFPKRMTEDFVRDELWISNRFLMDMGRRLPDDFLATRQNPHLIRTARTKCEHIGQLFSNGVQESENQQFRWENAVLGHSILLFVEICRALIDKEIPHVAEETSALFDRIMAYIEQNLSKKITLSEIADTFFVSKSTINRVFQKYTGTSFYRCLTQRRLLAAQQLMLGGMPLEKVSSEIGFSDYATFYRAFKSEFGISPLQYRKANQEARS